MEISWAEVGLENIVMHLAMIKQNDSISASFWNTSLWYVRISGSGSRIAELFAHIRITPITEITQILRQFILTLFVFFSIELPSLWGAAWMCAHLCLHTMGRCTTSSCTRMHKSTFQDPPQHSFWMGQKTLCSGGEEPHLHALPTGWDELGPDASPEILAPMGAIGALPTAEPGLTNPWPTPALQEPSFVTFQ